jgi:hypothetical protein
MGDAKTRLVRGKMKDYLLAILILLLLLWGPTVAPTPIQGYRYMEPEHTFPPRLYEWIIPYKWWKQTAVYNSFVACEEKRMEEVTNAIRARRQLRDMTKREGRDIAKENKISVDHFVDDLYQRDALAQCVPVR